MKKLSIVFLTLLAVSLTACGSQDDTNKANVPDNPGTVAGDDGVGAVVELRQGVIVSGDSTSAPEQKGYTQFYTYSYRSRDAHGDTLRLSALIGWPQGKPADIKPSTLLMGCHITITDDTSAPMNIDPANPMNDIGMLMAHAVKSDATGYNALVIMPDYEGYGVTNNRPHPYLCQELTARQVVDAVRAGLKFFRQKGFELAPDYKSIVAGYSQGGAVAMATHRFIEQQGLADTLHFSGSVCGDGPYDVLTTFSQYISSNRVYMPVVAPLMLQGLCSSHPAMQKYRPEDFLTAEFCQTGVLELIARKELSTSEINDSLIRYAETHPGTLHFRYDDNGSYLSSGELLRPEVIAYLKDGNEMGYDSPAALVEALQDNCVWGLWRGFDNWQPSHPIEILHSVTDEVVPYDNFLRAESYFTQYLSSRSYTGSFFSRHVSTGYMFFLYHCTDMMQQILQGKASKMNKREDI